MLKEDVSWKDIRPSLRWDVLKQHLQAFDVSTVTADTMEELYTKFGTEPEILDQAVVARHSKVAHLLQQWIFTALKYKN